MSKNRPIQIRKYYALEIVLDSPLCISNGQSEATDRDVLVNGSGKPFIPGTSLVGAMRNYLKIDKNQENIFGFSFMEQDEDNDDKKIERTAMSSVFVSDIYFDSLLQKKDKHKRPVISTRDGVALDEEKQVKGNSKFDMQIIETGAKGILYLNYLIRENDLQENFEEALYKAFSAIQEGFIRIGSNKNRGCGHLKIEKIHQREFKCGQEKLMSDEELKKWIKFKKNSRKISSYSTHQTFEEWKIEQKDNSLSTTGLENVGKVAEYIRFQIPLRLTGGISIRKYTAVPGEADYSHITCNGKPVIPGTSWNGAIRADVRDILTELGAENKKINYWINKWFGFVSQDDKTAKQSKVIIAESIIDNSKSLQISRNKINRFDASTVKGALYTEIAYFGGTTTLVIMVSQDDETSHWKALIAVLDLVIQDIKEGYLPVGGLVSIGRGIFDEDLKARKEDYIYPSQKLLEEGRKDLYDLMVEKEKNYGVG